MLLGENTHFPLHESEDEAQSEQQAESDVLHQNVIVCAHVLILHWCDRLTGDLINCAGFQMFLP